MSKEIRKVPYTGPRKRPAFSRTDGKRRGLGQVTARCKVSREEYARLVAEAIRQGCTLTELTNFYFAKAIGPVIRPDECACSPATTD
jgi:hypothetical protein